MAEEQVNTVTLRLRMENISQKAAGEFVQSLKDIAGAAEDASDNLADAVGAAGSSSGASASKSALGGIGSLLGGISGRAGVAATAVVALGGALLKASGMAREARLETDRLKIALNDNVESISATQSAIADLSKTSVFGQPELSGVAEQLLERGVPTDQLNKALLTTVNTASALRLPIQDVGDQIAQTYGGIIPKALGRAVPQLHELTTAAMESGGALDLLNSRFDGYGEKFLATDSGRIQASLKDIKQGWIDVGEAITPIESQLLPSIAKLMKGIGDVAQNRGGYGIADIGNRVLQTVTNAAGLDVYGLEPGQLEASAKAAQDRRDSAELQAKGDAAVGNIKDLVGKINQVVTDGTEESSKAAVELARKSAEEEFKQRTISLTRYLSVASQAALAEQKRLSDLAASQAKDLGITTGDEGEQEKVVRDKSALIVPGAKDNQRNQDVVNQSLDRLSQDLEKELSLRESLAKTHADLATVNHQILDTSNKGIDEATKTLVTSSTEGAKSVENGVMTPEQLRTQVQQQTADINSAIQIAYAQIDQVHLSDKFFSADDAAAMKKNIADAFGFAVVEANKTVASVTPLVSDMNLVGDAFRKASTSGLAEALTNIETGAKSASEAFGDMAKSIIKSVLDIINERIAEKLSGALFGPEQKGGPPGGSSPITGGLLGSIGSIFTANGSNGSPSIATSIVNSTTGALESAGTAIGNVAGGAASEIGSAASWVGTILGSLFAEGGYTGAGHPSTPAGVVHKGEFVLPANRVSAIGLDTLNLLHSGRINSLGRSEYRPNVAGIMSSINASGGMGGGDNSRQLNQTLSQVRDVLGEVADSHAKPSNAILVGDRETARQWLNAPGVPAELAEMMKRNPSIMKPALSKLGNR